MLPVMVLLVQFRVEQYSALGCECTEQKIVPLKFFLICMIENLMQRTGIALVVKCIENKQVKKQVNPDEYQKVHRNMLT